MRNYLSGALKSMKDYKAENPRALRLGLLTTGLGMMQGAGRTYDRPVSTVGLMGEAGLKGLGTYEAAREQDIKQKQKGLEETAKQERYLGRMKKAEELSKAEISARKGLKEYEIGEAGELAEYRADRAMELEKHRIASRRPDAAAQRLSWAKEQATKEQAAKDFTTRAGGIMGKYITRTEAGEMLDPKMEPIYRKAQAMAIDDPSKALEFLSSEVSRLDKIKTDRAELLGMSEKQLNILRAEEVERIRVSQLTPEARAGEEAVQSAAKRAAAVRSLAAKYEEENAPPSIFGRLSEAWRTRKQYPATAPIGLR